MLLRNLVAQIYHLAGYSPKIASYLNKSRVYPNPFSPLPNPEPLLHPPFSSLKIPILPLLIPLPLRSNLHRLRRRHHTARILNSPPIQLLLPLPPQPILLLPRRLLHPQPPPLKQATLPIIKPMMSQILLPPLRLISHHLPLLRRLNRQRLNVHLIHPPILRHIPDRIGQQHRPRRQQIRILILVVEVQQEGPERECEQHAERDVDVHRSIREEFVHHRAVGGEGMGVALRLLRFDFCVRQRGAIVARCAGDAPGGMRGRAEPVGLFEDDLAFAVRCGVGGGGEAAGWADVGLGVYGSSWAEGEA